MKKILAIAIVAVMAVALCLGASAIHNEEDTTSVWFNKDEFKYSWDTIYINGQSHMDLGWGADGGAPGKLAEHQPLSGADIDTFTIRGWAGLIDGTVAEWGYKVNEGTPVFNADFTKPTEDAVIGAGGDSRFEIVVPVNKATAPTLITACAKDENGNVYDFIEFSLNGQYTGAPQGGGETPATSESKAALSLSADDIYALFEGNTAANTVTAEKKDGYVTFTAGGEDPFFAFAQPLNPGADAKYAVVKYRYEGEGDRTIDFYLQIAEPHARAAIETDGEWHYVIIDCSVPFPETMDTLWDGTIARFDPLSGNGITDTSIDIASIEFFASEADAQAAASEGGQQGGNDDNPTTADAAIIAVAAVACLALAGVVVAKKVR